MFKDRIAPFHDPFWIGGQICSVIVNTISALAGGKQRAKASDFMPLPPAEYSDLAKGSTRRGALPDPGAAARHNHAVMNAMMTAQASKG